jgi:hypothetical protein
MAPIMYGQAAEAALDRASRGKIERIPWKDIDENGGAAEREAGELILHTDEGFPLT